MTWIVGTPSFFGYAVAISDIRATWPDGITRDCLQKVYPVGRFIAAGFAGSVLFGFQAIGDLRQHLHLDDPMRAWIPGKAIFGWYRRARAAFANAPDFVRKAGAEIMLLGASPSVDLGIPGFARPTVAILRAPDFFPHILKMNHVESIGSGTGVEKYAEELRSLTREDDELFKMEVGSRGGYAAALQIAIHETIKGQPEATVSSHVHLCMVQRGGIFISKSDHNIYPPGGPVTEFRMPPVATTWADFQELSRAASVDANAAVC